MLKKIVESPYLNIIAGVILILAAGVEIYETVEESQVGAHHGLFVFAIIHILKSIPEILHGLDDIEKAKKK
jgi:hypothetical protein